MYGIQEELVKNPSRKILKETDPILCLLIFGDFFQYFERFQGNKILFIHTGGIYGFIDGSMEAEIRKSNPISNLAEIIDL